MHSSHSDSTTPKSVQKSPSKVIPKSSPTNLTATRSIPIAPPNEARTCVRHSRKRPRTSAARSERSGGGDTHGPHSERGQEPGGWSFSFASRAHSAHLAAENSGSFPKSHRAAFFSFPSRPRERRSVRPGSRRTVAGPRARRNRHRTGRGTPSSSPRRR